MAEKEEERESFDGKKVKILGENYEEGKPEAPYSWQEKLKERKDILKYLETGERYWFSKEPYGSEKRRTPA